MVQAPMTAFTGFLNRVREGREGFWSFHANDYIRKITLEYLKAPSRGQRFNYRRRLKSVSCLTEYLYAPICIGNH